MTNSFQLLCGLKWATVKNSFRRLKSRSTVELLTLTVFLLGAGAGLFAFFFYGFRFFASQEPFGPILIDETFFLFNFALFVMLFISSAVSAYTSLYRSGEVLFLLAHPVKWTEIYFIKFVEALWYSSWSFLFVAVPFMTAYGLNKNVSLFYYPLLCLAFYVPFVILAGMLGSLAAVFAVALLPKKRSRAIALLIFVGGLALLFIRLEPQLIKEQGSLAGIMSGYLPHVAFAKNALLPSSWVTRGILALNNIQTSEYLSWQTGVFYLLVLLSNALFCFLPSYSIAGRLYPASFLRAQDHAEIRQPKRARYSRIFEKAFDAIAWPSRPALAFLEKDLKTFARDPAEWSQLIIFFGLLLLYFVNLRNLEFHVLKSFWKNLVFVLNTVGTYVVLSSFSMRFVFPMLSMEGTKAWIIGIAPVRPSSILLEKFLLGAVISLFLTLPLVFLSGWMLEISIRRIFFTTGLGFFVCVALTGLSVGLGAKFINLKSNNPTEIISGFGGSMLLVTHLLYLGFIGIFLLLSREPQWLIFWTMAAASLLIGTIPLKVGVNALKRMEF